MAQLGFTPIEVRLHKKGKEGLKNSTATSGNGDDSRKAIVLRK